MTRKARLNLGLAIAAVIIAAAAVIAFWYVSTLPQHIGQHETVVLGQDRLTPGSTAAMRVLVNDSATGQPLPDAEVTLSLQPKDNSGPVVQIFSGRSDADGLVNVSFKVPADAAAEQRLIVETHSKLGQDKFERDVTLVRDYRILLTTDKPLYQSGQVLHMRALALSTFDLQAAAGQTLILEVADGKGNKVFRKVLTTNDYGVAAADFQLASEVNSGNYKISAALGNTVSEKTVTVEYYVLPKFDINLETEAGYYQPGQTVRGSLKAAYFFGKPVSEGVVTLDVFTFDVQQNLILTLQGKTDAEGNYDFEFQLPDFIAGSDLEGGLGRVYLQAGVVDQAEHREQSSLSLPVSQSGLIIEAALESGQVIQGLENILYVLVSTPNGSPIKANLDLDFYESAGRQSLQTNDYGLAEVRFTPDNPYVTVTIHAAGENGAATDRTFSFSGESNSESILLRTDKPVYKVGQTMNLDLFSTASSGLVYLDIIRDNQTISTRSVKLEKGRAQAAVDLTPDLAGTLEVHAYRILYGGTIVRDTRLVVVDNADELMIQLKAGQDSYLPGGTADLNLTVNALDGSGVQSAVGLAIVDESVFALAQQDPGFARLYFMLEAEILTPRYDLHGFSVPDLMYGIPSNDPALKDSVASAARASLAAAPVSSYTLTANSHEEAVRQAAKIQGKAYTILMQIFSVLFILASLAIIWLLVAGVRADRVLGRSSLLTLGVLGLLFGFFLLLVANNLPNWLWDFKYFLSDMFSALARNMAASLACFGAVVLAAWIVLLVIAIQRKDARLGWAVGLLPIWIGLLVGMLFSGRRYDSNVRISGMEILIIGSLIAYLLVFLAFVLRGSGFAFAKRGWLAIMAFILAGALILSMLPLTAVTAMGGAMAPQPQVGMIEEAMIMPAAVPTAAPAAQDKNAFGGADQTASANAEPPRLRQYFPETMLWLPDALTDEQGVLDLQTPLADSITTWRMTALASSKDGRIGSVSAPLLVFQDFFIDLDLPLSLTVGDEVSIPVGVYNYMTDEQSVRLEVQPESWFELLDEPVKEMTIPANDINVVYFRIRALDFGAQPFQVTAIGSKMSDAIRKEVRVYPDGMPITQNASNVLNPGQTASEQVFIPAETVAGTQKVIVKIFPGMVAQVVDGLEGILRMPNGCFEQTSSSAYPNVLVMDYLNSTGKAAPEVQMQAEEYLNIGYQRLLTFEVEGGGFSLFGDAPADRMLTAYGLQEFSDMARVMDVDPQLTVRAARWLLDQQNPDGSWENDRGLVHESTWANLQNDRLPVTAYITWSLIVAGQFDDPGVQRGLDYLRENNTQAEDPYSLALLANALAAAAAREGSLDSAAASVLDRLAGLAHNEGDASFWTSQIATFVGGEGKSASIETTALAVLAFQKSLTHLDLANRGLLYLVRGKDSYGTWYTTQATVLSLKALLGSVQSGGSLTNAAVTVTLNGGQAQTVQVTPENFDVVQLLTFEDLNPGAENRVELQVEGQGNLMYQVTTSYYLPWGDVAKYPDLAPVGDLVTIDVQYDRAELAVNETVTVKVKVSLNQPGGVADSAIVDLGLPPGFTLRSEDLAALVARYNDVPPDYDFARLERFETTPRQIIIYLTHLSNGKPLEFSYRLQARYPLRVQSPASTAYDYYNPDVNGQNEPQTLVVMP